MIHLLLAVHISDGVLSWSWLVEGFALAASLLYWSSRQVSDEEIPRIGLLTPLFLSLLSFTSGSGRRAYISC